MNLRRAVKRLESAVRGRAAYKFFLRDWIALPDLQSAADVVKTLRFSRKLDSLPMERPLRRKIVVLAPHPDDEILGAGGTLLHAIAAGIPVTVIYLTSGLPPEETEAEARKVSADIGFKAEFLRLPVKGIDAGEETLSALAALLQREQPDCIFLPFLLDDHDDHRRVPDLFLRLCRGGHFDPSGVEVWAYQVYSVVWPNVVVDVTDVAERKAAAMRLYATQMKTRDWAHYVLGMNAFMSRFLRDGPAGPRYAEAFFVVPAEDYLALCEPYFRDPKIAYLDQRYTNGSV